MEHAGIQWTLPYMCVHTWACVCIGVYVCIVTRLNFREFIVTIVKLLLNSKHVFKEETVGFKVQVW